MNPDYNKYELTRQQTRGLLLLLAASAITLGIAVWRSYRPATEQEPIPQEVIEQFNHISAYSDTTAATPAKKPGKKKESRKSAHHSSPVQKQQTGKSAPQRDITTENL